MKEFFRFVNFLFSTIGTFTVLCLIIALLNDGSLEFVSVNFGFLLVLILSVFINLVMDYVIHDM